MSIKDVIARCIERMRAGACAACENRSVCPAGRWQQAFGPPRQRPEHAGASTLLAFFGPLAGALNAAGPRTRCFRREVEDAIERLLGGSEVSIERVARDLGMSRQTLYRRLKAEGLTFEQILEAKRRSLAIRYLQLNEIGRAHV